MIDKYENNPFIIVDNAWGLWNVCLLLHITYSDHVISGDKFKPPSNIARQDIVHAKEHHLDHLPHYNLIIIFDQG